MRLDYEETASYSLTVQVTDSFDATADATVTISVINLDTIAESINGLELSTAQQGLWGDDTLISLLDIDVSKSLTQDLGALTPQGSVGSLMSYSLDGDLTATVDLSIDDGNLETYLPIELNLSYPDEIVAGNVVTLNADISLGSDASFSVTSPALSLTRTFSLTDYDIQVSADMPDVLNSLNVNDINLNESGTQAATGDTYNSSTTTVTGTASTEPLRMEASISLPNWINESINTGSLSETQTSINTWFVNQWLSGCREDGLTSFVGEDLGWDFGYDIYTGTLTANVGLTQSIALELEPVGLLTKMGSANMCLISTTA